MIPAAASFTTRPSDLATSSIGLEASVRGLLKDLRLEYKDCRDVLGARGFAAYGVHHEDKDNAWAVRLVATHGRDPGTVSFELATLFKVCGEDWYLTPDLALDGNKITHIQRWTSPINGPVTNSSPLCQTYLDAVRWTFARNRRARSDILSAERDTFALRRQFGADATGNVTIPGTNTGVCQIVADGKNAAAEFHVKVKDPAKISAILAILNDPEPSSAPARRRPSIQPR